MNPNEEGESRARNLRGRAQTSGEATRPSPYRVPLLALLLATLLLALLVAAVLFLGSFGDELSGTSIVRDSIPSGPRPSVRLTNAAGQVGVEGAAEEGASGVPVDVSREDGSVFVLETDGGGGTGADYALKVPRGGGGEVESEAGDVGVSGRFSGGGRVSVETGDVRDRLPTHDTRELTLETTVGEVVREPPGSPEGEENPKKGGGA